ncbi:unnamed protein product [Lactuca virosa]|uniref:Uncharacterized protein n=1 Tax=Lactuca virosa TaxID=75947 RepID=A0AAU9LX80_9ASTR|nr:unnamed protein product [Lactuca virosa]
MAFCSITYAASGFVVKSNISSTFETFTIKSAMVMFPSKNTRSSRLVVKAAEEAAAPVAAGATYTDEDKSKPPPIGPKRGTQEGHELVVVVMVVVVVVVVEEMEVHEGWLVRIEREEQWH